MPNDFSTLVSTILDPDPPDVPPQAAVNGTAPPPPPLLTPAHFDMLTVASAIAPEVIRERGYQSLAQPDDLIDRGFSKAQAKAAPALGLPRWNVHGIREGWIIRPENPRVMATGKINKYEGPKGSGLILDIHPRCQPDLANPAVPLWITEGIKKGDALVSQGACAIALSGVWGFKGTNAHGGKVILPDWQHVALNGRTVYVVYDSDLATKPGVAAALKALYVFLRSAQAIPSRVQWPGPLQQSKLGVDDYFAQGHTLADLLALVPPPGPLPATPPPPAAVSWHAALACSKDHRPYQSIGNFVLAIQQLDPWHSAGCWYDLVREEHMVGDMPVLDGDDTAAAVVLEREIKTPVSNIKLVGRALDYVCRQTRRDCLQEWVNALDTVDVSALLTNWLRTYAHVPSDVPDAYVGDVSRVIVVGMIARILQPGCQFRSVAILEGPENAGKSKLCKALAGTDPFGRSWHVALSAGLEGKESHMMLEGALVAELEELSSYRKTDKNRMKALITAQADSFIPKFANKRVDHPRRTIFIGTVNPEGDKAYLDDQTGNTRYLPIAVSEIDIDGFLAMRTQLFAEAKAYYLAHQADWWQLESEEDAANEREERRQAGLYESKELHTWLENRAQLSPARCTWQEVADQFLMMPKKDCTRATAMEIAKAFRAYGWLPKRSEHERYWEPG